MSRLEYVAWAVGIGAALGGPVAFFTALMLRAGGKERLRWDDQTVPIAPLAFYGYGTAIGGTLGFSFGVILSI